MITVEQQPVSVLRRIHRAIALPVNTLALILNYLSDGLGRLAAWIAGDNRR